MKNQIVKFVLFVVYNIKSFDKISSDIEYKIENKIESVHIGNLIYPKYNIVDISMKIMIVLRKMI